MSAQIAPFAILAAIMKGTSAPNGRLAFTRFDESPKLSDNQIGIFLVCLPKVTRRLALEICKTG